MKVLFHKGREILVDDEDFDLIKDKGWCYKDTGHVLCTINNKHVYIHHLIMGKGLRIDHIDRNPLNNQKNNLRVCTQSKNCMNTKLRTDNTSGIKGISWYTERSNWEVYINIDKKRKRLGRYKTLKEAALVRIDAEERLFGEFANHDLIKEVKCRIENQELLQ